jgi:hypothetical protein
LEKEETVGGGEDKGKDREKEFEGIREGGERK